MDQLENIICTMNDVRGDFLGKVSFRLLNNEFVVLAILFWVLDRLWFV